MKLILEQNFSEITIHTVAENWLSQRYVAVAWHSWSVCTVTMTGSDNVCNEQINNFNLHLSPVVRKPDFCLCENKGVDQLRSNCEADQRLCFRYMDSTISHILKSQISSF